MKQFFMEQGGSGNKEKFVIKDRRGEETYTVIFNDLEEELLIISDLKKDPVVLVKQIKVNLLYYQVKKQLFLLKEMKKHLN